VAQRVVTVNDVLDGHVALDIECLDQVYLNACVPILQSRGQVVVFMTQHLGCPIPSPALSDKIAQKFRRSVASFVEANGIPWIRFGKAARVAASRSLLTAIRKSAGAAPACLDRPTSVEKTTGE
jgi:hypothetical protein